MFSIKTEKFLKFFKGNKEKKLNNSDSGRLRRTLSKISGAFLLPISVMSIAGMFLGVGAAIAGIDKSNFGLVLFGDLIKALGEPVFASLPLLFAVAFVIAFTDEAGVAVFATVIGYLVFASVQSVFIWPEYTYSLKDADSSSIEKLKDAANNVKDLKVLNKELVGYTILFKAGGRSPESLKQVVGSTLGVTSLQTSVFGGIAVGLIVQWIYRKFHTIQLPQFISFFGGKRFVSLVTIPTMAVFALIFIIFWPWIGIVLNLFGNLLSKAPLGVESLIFGFLERSLVPFGLHHAFYAPLWYSDAGGNVSASVNEFLKHYTVIKDAAEATKYDVNYLIIDSSLQELINKVNADPSQYVGDSTAALSLLKLDDTVDYKLVYLKEGKRIIETYKVPLFEFVAHTGVKIGRFTDGKFAFMIFGLPAAGLAMILAAPKENRKVAIGAVFPAALTAAVTGVTEPIEFTFLFLAPYMFWGFHAAMCAISFMLANILGVHIPQAFSGGFLDLLLYGIIPFAKGTNFYLTFVVGIIYAPIYFVVFYFVIKWKDLGTPGRGQNLKLFTKADYINRNKELNSSSNESSDSEFKNIDHQALAIVQGLGGTNNISAYNNCASRLRYDVRDLSLVNERILKEAGAYGIKFEGETHVQIIIGPAAEQLNAMIKSQRELIAKYEMKSQSLTEQSLESNLNQEMAQDSRENVQSLNMEQAQMTESMKNSMEVSETSEEIKETFAPMEEIIDKKPIKVQTAAVGEIKNLEELSDGVFSAKIMGNGFAVKFNSKIIGNVYSPVSGVISMVFPSKHAYGIKTKDGAELLVHIGIDTVKLNGEGFKNFVEKGSKVKAGDKLAQVDLKLLKSKKIVSDVVVIVLKEGTKNDFTFEENKNKVLTKSELVGKIR
ncbi:glucose PTS transporter subunit IIA [Mycoplasmopsis cynos]|uniref:Glucose PTS transporter subunit IIA n=2 Tax=Mycoplasmopsis cynos TaxID=171284 RepID=A0ABD8AK81_9BACT|nr:glucose PTS transporter subunit IIA [Mycoplasmopsis cynos]WQQ20097.1 glucose PTS transporter subunit IIA [Mycoplasmopsis cynos]